MSVVIRIDGTDITADVVIRTASFSSLVNGSPGQALLRVKDVAQTYEFASGGLLTLDVDSVRVWGGFIMSAKKVYALPVMDTTSPPAVTRVWEIIGADHNILFNKRIVFKESDPTGKINFSYDADTYDDTIIGDIFDNYLDIAADSLTRTGVQRIAKAILDVPGKTHSGLIASAGFTWKQMMDSVQRATGGIYYLDASRDLKYVDVETSTSDYTLIDQPVGAFDVGFQGFTLLENGSDLVNDMLVWGAGNGSKNVVFSRTQDSSSIAEHGRWQLPLFTSGLYRQASAEIVADSYVYGTPQSHRGGKDDAVTFNARVFEPKFAAGDVVDVVCGIFDYTDALPIRRMTITFLSPTEPIFDLILGHAIDQPIGLFEFIGARLGGFPPFPGIDLPGGIAFPPAPSGCDCGMFDLWNRLIAVGWSTSDAGIPYANNVNLTGVRKVLVDGSRGYLAVPAATRPAGPSQQATATQATAATLYDYPIDWACTLEFTDLLQTNFHIDFGEDGFPVEITLVPSAGTANLNGWFNDSPTTISGIDFTVPQRIRIQVDEDGSTMRIRFWEPSDPEPETWDDEFTDPDMIGVAAPHTRAFDCNLVDVRPGGASYAETGVYFEDLAFSHGGIEVNRCTAIQFEDFENRSYANTSHVWGNANPSNKSWVLDTYLNTYQYVEGGYGIIRNNNVVPSSSGYGYLSVHEAVVPEGSDWHVRIPVISTSTTSVYNTVVGFTIDGIHFDWFRNGTGTPLLRAEAATSPAEVEENFPFPTFWSDLAGGTAIMEAERIGSTFRMRLYALAGAVPDWQLVTSTDRAGPATVEGYMGVNTSVSPSTSGQTELKIGEIEPMYPSRPCYQVNSIPVLPVQTVPSTGQVCETISHSGGTDFATARAFFSGSLEVWVNGTQQTNFTFTAVLGEFSLTSSIDASDELRVCYRANGDPI